MDFASLDLPAPVMQGIREAGFATATPIQEAALPLALRGKDVAGQSQTGTGKTAAFLIAGFTRLLRSPAPSTPAGRGAPPAPRTAAAPQTSVVPLLRDALVPGARAHVGVHEQPVPDHDHAAAKDGRARGADALPRRPRREVSAAPRSPQARGWRPDPDLHEHPRGSAAARGPADAQPLRHARADRRRGPEAAPQDPERLQGGPAARARGDRRRLARPPHRGGEPRRQDRKSGG